MYGLPRERKTRLRDIATKGSLNIKVDPYLGWKLDDQIAILTSNSDWKASEDAFIESYDE